MTRAILILTCSGCGTNHSSIEFRPCFTHTQAVRVIYCEPVLTTHIIRQADVDLSALLESESILCYAWTPSGSLLLGCSGGRVLAVHHAVPPAVPSDEWGSQESYLEAVEVYPTDGKQRSTGRSISSRLSGAWGMEAGGGEAGREVGGSGRFGLAGERSSIQMSSVSSMNRGMAAGIGDGTEGYGDVVSIVPMPEHIVLLFSGGESQISLICAVLRSTILI